MAAPRVAAAAAEAAVAAATGAAAATTAAGATAGAAARNGSKDAAGWVLSQIAAPFYLSDILVATARVYTRSLAAGTRSLFDGALSTAALRNNTSEVPSELLPLLTAADAAADAADAAAAAAAAPVASTGASDAVADESESKWECKGEGAELPADAVAAAWSYLSARQSAVAAAVRAAVDAADALALIPSSAGTSFSDSATTAATRSSHPLAGVSRVAAAVFRAPLIVGLHPDQPTEDALDTAWLLGKPCAVVPCCVFPSLRAERRGKDGEAVVTYPQFVDYLSRKFGGAVKVAYLPLEGRNRVVYLSQPQEE